MKSELLIHFGERIRELRKETGFHRTYIGMIERGERNLSLLNIQIFAKTFKITLQELFNFYE